MTQTIIIRDANINDAPEISSLVCHTIRISNAPNYSTSVISKLVQNFSAENVERLINARKVWVAVIDETIVGTASLDDNTVRTVFVLPSAQGQGVGRGLIQTVENMARNRGHKTLRVPSSLTAHGFYTQLGYSDVRKVLYCDELTIVMEKTLV
jgi:GNAT superfamily N-acetyltransferase